MFASLLIVLGLALIPGGVELIWLGGSTYYASAGLALCVSGVLLWRARIEGAYLYALFFLATVAWSLWETGAELWPLLPRVPLFALLGAWLLQPATQRRLNGSATGSARLARIRFAVALAVAVVLGLALHAVSRNVVRDPAFDRGTVNARTPTDSAHIPTTTVTGAVPAGDWPNYGNDRAGSRFSPLAKLTPQNVERLRLAWEYHVGPGADGAGGNLEATPLKVNDTLYVCSAYSDVIALDAETGHERWRYRSGIDRKGFPYFNCRGVAYFKTLDASGECSERIISTTADSRLIALDARTGNACRTFGQDGSTSLLTGMGEVGHGYYFVTSAPTIIRGKIVVGGWVADGQYWGEPGGVIRAFDAATGQFAWAFDVGHPDRQSEPPPGDTYTRATPNSWAPMSADEELGLVYAPTGNSTPDYYGAQRRPFDDRYSSSVIAIDAETGKVRWSFQTVHHDLWDYDVASQPTLIDIQTAEGLRKALLQPTKRGELFLLDRVTGEPIAPVQELPVPQKGHAPGERLSPTQPFSVGMPPLTGPRLTEAMTWGLTPYDQLWCRIAFRQARYDGPLTPPGETMSILSPGYAGGMNWGGAAIDLDRQLLVVNTLRFVNHIQLISRSEADRRGLVPMSERSHSNIGGGVAQAGTPFAVEVGPFMSPLFMPCQQPPFGMISAVDLISRKLIWTHPIGTTRDSGPLGTSLGIQLTVGMPNLGGPIITRGGLTFIGATQDAYLRAYETATGRLLWQDRLPAGGNATPMTYLSSQSGRQFVVIAVGGHLGMNRPGDSVIAYALPQQESASP